MKQKSLTTIPALRGAAAIMKAAAAEYGAEIPLVQNTAANLGADADALTTACNNHEAGKVVLADKRLALTALVATIRTFLTLGRDILKPELGPTYSTSYTILGLVGSAKIPRDVGSLLIVLLAFKAYFTEHAEQEDEVRNVTAAQCQALYDQLLTAQSTVNSQGAAVSALLKARNAAATKLRKRVRGLIDELTQFLDPQSGLWEAFGLNKPGSVSTPDQVKDLVATLIGPGVIAMKWSAAARADYYHVFKKVVGVDQDYVLVGSPMDIDFNLEGLPAASTIDIVVTAVSAGGESIKSEKVTLVTHA
jgi:hypothetical protein